jgi:hypothetical protein
MPALVAGIHVFTALQSSEDVDGRDKPGHDEPLVSVQRDRKPVDWNVS